MQLGYVIVYVPKVAESLQFFTDAFGFERKLLHESGTYGELSTGSTTLAFASHELGRMNFSGGHVSASDSPRPLGMEIAIVANDVEEAHRRALERGAIELAKPKAKPWGQVVSYVRSPDGTLIELCTPIGV